MKGRIREVTRPHYMRSELVDGREQTTLTIEVVVEVDGVLFGPAERHLMRFGGDVHLSATDYERQLAGTTVVSPSRIAPALFMLDHAGDDADELAFTEARSGLEELWAEAGSATRASYTARAARVVAMLRAIS